MSQVVSWLISGRADVAPSTQRISQPIIRPPNSAMTMENGVSASVASPLMSSAAVRPTHQRDQRARRVRSVTTRNAMNATSKTNVVGMRSWMTATATGPP